MAAALAAPHPATPNWRENLQVLPAQTPSKASRHGAPRAPGGIAGVQPGLWAHIC